MTRRGRVCGIAAFLSLCGVVSAADWPQWRGPHRDGVSPETGLLKSWPSEGPPLLWSVSGCGNGFSSIAVVGGIIYGTGSEKGRNRMWARREQSGELLWSAQYSEHAGEPNSTPVVADGKVYALTREGDLACLNASDGQPVVAEKLRKRLRRTNDVRLGL